MIDESSVVLLEPLQTSLATNESTGDICEDDLLAKFASGYHVFLQQNCASCHDGNHEAPAFASSSPFSSYQVFQDKGYQLVSANAVSATHNPPYTGSKNASAIGLLKSDWEAATKEYNTCQGGPGSVGQSLVTTDKFLDTAVKGKTNNNWYPYSWDLNSEVKSGPRWPLKLDLQVQVAKVNGVEVGYAFRNPTITLASGSDKYRVTGIFFKYRGVLQSSATVYRNVQAVICSGQPFNFGATGNAQLLVTDARSVTDTLGIQITSIEQVSADTACGSTMGSGTGGGGGTTGPTSVSFTQLVSNDAQLGVFRKNCLSCHAGGSARAGLDLSNYAQSKAKASSILNRMNDSASPMPPTGLLPSQSRSIVETWVQTGTPQ